MKKKNAINRQRRKFMQTMAASTLAIPGLSALSSAAFAVSGTAEQIVVSVFLRGGADGLSAVVPCHDAIYYDSRPTIAIPEKGCIDLDGQFALHRALAPLKSLYDQRDLAFVVAAGLGVDASTRSHFDAQKRMEAGSAHSTLADGWLGRYFNLESSIEDSRLNASGVFTAVGMGKVPKALAGFKNSLGIDNLSSFRLNLPGTIATDKVATTLRNMYHQSSYALLENQAAQALLALEVAAEKALSSVPMQAEYGDSKFAQAFHQIAELILADVGLQAATIDMQGWDLHRAMGSWQAGDMKNLLAELATVLSAFHHETAACKQQITVVVMSEFGRRVAENTSGGTDHGKGGVMMVLGQGINGGKVYGDWPGLEVLDRGDLKVTTDYRQVLAELLDVRLAQNNISDAVFPELNSDTRLGIF